MKQLWAYSIIRLLGVVAFMLGPLAWLVFAVRMGDVGWPVFAAGGVVSIALGLVCAVGANRMYRSRQQTTQKNAARQALRQGDTFALPQLVVKINGWHWARLATGVAGAAGLCAYGAWAQMQRKPAGAWMLAGVSVLMAWLFLFLAKFAWQAWQKGFVLRAGGTGVECCQFPTIPWSNLTAIGLHRTPDGQPTGNNLCLSMGTVPDNVARDGPGKLLALNLVRLHGDTRSLLLPCALLAGHPYFIESALKKLAGGHGVRLAASLEQHVQDLEQTLQISEQVETVMADKSLSSTERMHAMETLLARIGQTLGKHTGEAQGNTVPHAAAPK